MSRVANAPVEIPKGVDVTVDGGLVSVKGKNGQLRADLSSAVNIVRDGDTLTFAAANNSSHSNAQAGTARAVVNNMIVGVASGFEKRLQLIGVGYRAQVQGNLVNLTVGYSHPVQYTLPEGITAETPSQTEIVIKGADKQQVGQVAAEIRSVRPPEPYKGKGVRIDGEYVRRKEAKKK